MVPAIAARWRRALGSRIGTSRRSLVGEGERPPPRTGGCFGQGAVAPELHDLVAPCVRKRLSSAGLLMSDGWLLYSLISSAANDPACVCVQAKSTTLRAVRATAALAAKASADHEPVPR